MEILTISNLLKLLASRQQTSTYNLDIVINPPITEEQLRASTYKLGNRTLIRLFNSKEDLATIPALLASTKDNKHLLGLVGHRTSRTEEGPAGPISYYSNISPLRPDQNTTNRKTDLIVDMHEILLKETLSKIVANSLKYL